MIPTGSTSQYSKTAPLNHETFRLMDLPSEIILMVLREYELSVDIETPLRNYIHDSDLVRTEFHRLDRAHAYNAKAVFLLTENPVGPELHRLARRLWCEVLDQTVLNRVSHFFEERLYDLRRATISRMNSRILNMGDLTRYQVQGFPEYSWQFPIYWRFMIREDLFQAGKRKLRENSALIAKRCITAEQMDPFFVAEYGIPASWTRVGDEAPVYHVRSLEDDVIGISHELREQLRAGWAGYAFRNTEADAVK